MDWIVPNDINEFAKIDSINRQLKKAKSPKTEANLRVRLQTRYHSKSNFVCAVVELHPNAFQFETCFFI